MDPLEMLMRREWTLDSLAEVAIHLARATNRGEADEQRAVITLATATMYKGREALLRAVRRSLYESANGFEAATAECMLAADLCDQAIVFRRALQVLILADQIVMNYGSRLGEKIVSIVLIGAAQGETDDITPHRDLAQSAIAMMNTVVKRSAGDDIDVIEVLDLAETTAHSQVAESRAEEVASWCARAREYHIAHPIP
jgi:prophage DNA circulation protein